jgi:predicted RND superfamily exporter protein
MARGAGNDSGMDAPLSAPGRHERSVGFGVERIGIAALRYPAAAVILLAIALTAAVVGAVQLRFDDNLQNVFNSGAAEDVAYGQLARNFSVGEAEILIVAEAPDFDDVEALEALRRIHFEALLLEGVSAVTSVFSLREAPRGDVPPQILQPGLEGRLLQDALARVHRHPFNLGKLLSADRRFALLSVRMDRTMAGLGAQERLIANLRNAAEAALGGSPIKITVTGVPLLRIEIVRRLISDSINLNLLGAGIVILAGLVLFRSVRLTAIAVAPSMLAAACVLGGMGLAGVGINAMTIVIPVLILVLVFADSMHLTFVWAERRRAGATSQEAALAAMREVGPACVLATAITIIAFGAIAVSRTYIVIEFGLAGAAANIVGLCVLLVAHPVMCTLLGGTLPPAYADRGVHLLFKRVAAAAARLGAARPRAILAGGVLLAILTGIAHANLQPAYSVREHLPANDPVNAALTTIDRHLNGAFSVQLPIPLPAGAAPLSPAALAQIRKAHEAVRDVRPGSAVLSPWSFAEWLGARDEREAAQLMAPVWRELSADQRRRMISDSGTQALVTTWLGEMPAPEIDRQVARLEAALDKQGISVNATGLLVHSARKSQWILVELNLSLLAAAVVAIGLIVFAFRSFAAGIVSILPNVLPLLATGTLLLLMGRGLQFASVLALTIAFSIAVNDTIHYLNRYRHLRTGGVTRAKAVPLATRDVGPVMTATTAVICAGLCATFFSGLPLTSLFGLLCAFLLVVALVADLILLPASVLEYPEKWNRDF